VGLENTCLLQHKHFLWKISVELGYSGLLLQIKCIVERDYCAFKLIDNLETLCSMAWCFGEESSPLWVSYNSNVWN